MRTGPRTSAEWIGTSIATPRNRSSTRPPSCSARASCSSRRPVIRSCSNRSCARPPRRCSHTHAAGLLDKSRAHFPGGDLIAGYFDELITKVAESIQAAAGKITEATIVYGSGRCDLAQNRDFLDTERNEFVCGFNPDGISDDTVLVARINDSAGSTIATIVNYACHPTTLAWDNTLISPDYVGSMREVIESNTNAPCFFIQGASGDIGPRDGFVGDTAVAERNGRQLGFAALSALENLPVAGHRLSYTGAVISGATIGTWCHETTDDSCLEHAKSFQQRKPHVNFDLRDDMPSAEADRVEREHLQGEEQQARDRGDEAAAAEARARIERIDRRAAHMTPLDSADGYDYQAQVWKIGDAIWLVLNGEPYNLLQRELRSRFPDTPIIVATIANGSKVWYLPQADAYGKGLYQEMASIIKRGSLEKLIEALSQEIAEMVG